jgi:ABC-type sulfate/molybdate transport systems ATPase subunit
MLELRDVSRALGRIPILDRASIDFPSDVPTSVLGLSPRTRESILRLLSGADKPQTGTIRLGGTDISRARREKGKILLIGPGGEKPSGRKVGALMGADAAVRVGLADKLGLRIDALDAAERMRVAIGRARELRPSLLLVDAPASQLAGDASLRFVRDLGDMLGGAGAVVVLAAGSPAEAKGLEGRVVVLEHGRVLQHAPAAEVFGRPASLAVALATSYPALNTLAMIACEGRGVLPDGSTFHPPENFAFPSGGACTLAFRPEDANLERQSQGCVRFVVRTVSEETISARRFARVRFAGADWLAPLPDKAPPPGMVSNVFVDRARLMVFDAAGKMVV